MHGQSDSRGHSSVPSKVRGLWAVEVSRNRQAGQKTSAVKKGGIEVPHPSSPRIRDKTTSKGSKSVVFWSHGDSEEGEDLEDIVGKRCPCREKSFPTIIPGTLSLL